jgi:uncharacterized protein (DUF302 family)
MAVHLKVFPLIAMICLSGALAMAAEGLTTIKSHGPKDTMDRLEAEVKARGMTVFAHIDHAAGAAAAGLPLRPTDVLIFGNAKGGTPLMQSSQTIGIDLPLKVLVWQDAEGSTWLSYNDPSWLAKRHGLDRDVEATINALTAGILRLSGQQLDRSSSVSGGALHCTGARAPCSNV